MKHYSEIKNLDWNSYRKELDIFIDKKISLIQILLEKNFFIKEDKIFYYKIFFLPLSKYFFNNKFNSDELEEKRKLRFNFLKYLNYSNYLNKLKVHIFEDSKIKFSKNLSINFFHRHSEYKKICADIITEVNSENLKKKISLKSLLINFRLEYFSDLKKDKIFFLKRRILLLILNYQFLKKNITKVKNILISTHGIMGDEDQILLGCLSKKAKIFSLQSGYIHFKHKYFDQDDYLEKISSKILCWGKDVKKNSKYEIFGSFYAHKNKLVNNKKSVIILPQVPLRNNRVPMSSYFSYNQTEFTNFIINKIVKEIRIINTKDKSCYLQCKDADYEYYKKYFNIFKIKNKLVFSKVNSEKFGDTYLKTYIFCLSTSIIENYYAKSNIKICINSAWIDLLKNHQEKLYYVNNKGFLKKKDKFIQDSCQKISLNIAKKKIIKILQ